MPPLDRDPAAVVAAYAALAAPGVCCPHALGAHRTDGTCSLVGVRACDCTGWQPASPEPDQYAIGAEDTGACCAHPHAVHAPDGACRLERSTRCGCTGWRPLGAPTAAAPGGDLAAFILARAAAASADEPDPVEDADEVDDDEDADASWANASPALRDLWTDSVALSSDPETPADAPAATDGALDGDRLHAIARAIAEATDRYNGEGTAILAALARAGWRLERTTGAEPR